MSSLTFETFQPPHKDWFRCSSFHPCFKIPKPIPNPSTQPGGKMRCGKYIQNAVGPVAYRATTSKIITKPVNIYQSREGAPGGFGAPPRNVF